MLNRIKRHIFNLLHPVIGEVWQLHRITNEVASDENERAYEITPQRLEDLLAQAVQDHCKFCSIDNLTTALQDQAKNNKTSFINIFLPIKKYICLTLDDGYEDNLTYAVPLFHKFNVPFCIYITKDYIEHGHKNYRFLSLDQLRQLSSDPLCTLGCHTCTHPHLALLNQEAQIREISDCKHWLEELIGKSVQHLAYPYGSYNPTTINIARQAGFSSAVAAWGGGIRKGKRYNSFAIPRVLITQTTQEIYE